MDKPAHSNRRTGLADLSLSEVSALIQRRAISSRSVTEACLAAVAELQPRLNCFIHIEAEDALAQADAADAEIAAGTWRGPLHGVPLAHKDIFYRAGRRSTCGSKIRENYRPDVTATVIERLDASGAVDLGGLNLAEFCVGPTGHNDYFGHCHNPWDLERVPGGSSSGSGAAVAARLIYGSLGSDTGGSIRLPAGICGLVGLKPTHGRVSLYGAMPRCWSLDVFGPLTRTVRDAALMLQTIAGYDSRDPWSRAVEVPDYVDALDVSLQGVKIAIPENHLSPEVGPGIRTVHDVALDVMKELGAEIVPVVMPDPEELYDWTVVINRVEASYVHGEWIRSRRNDYNLSTISRIADGFDIPAVRYIEALDHRRVAQQELLSTVYAKADVLYAPLLLFDVPTLAETDIHTAASAAEIVHRVTQATRWVSFVGLPVLTLPVGFSSSGLPVAAQLVAPPFEEPILLTIGDAYQGATQWHERRPPNSA